MKKYVRASFNNDSIPSWLKEDKWALNALNKAGIDLANCEFSKTRQGKVGENYIAYHVTGTTYGNEYRPFVWIPGIYNDDNYVSAPMEYSWQAQKRLPKSKAIKYMAKKDIQYDDVVYINIGANSKKVREHYQDPRYDSDGKYAGQYWIEDKTKWNPETKDYDIIEEPAHWSKQGKETWQRRRGYQKRDKSGYVIPDPKERLRKFHESEEGKSRQGVKAQRQVQVVYGQLVNLKDAIMNDLNNSTIEDFGNKSNVMSYFQDAVRYYKNALNDLSDRGWGTDPNDALTCLSSADYYINKANDILTGKSNW